MTERGCCSTPHPKHKQTVRSLLMSNSIYHIHHIVPKHMGGSDDTDNLIKLTIEEHAEAHRKLYQEHGHWQDYVAWKGLSGRIGKEDLIRLKLSFVHKGKKDSLETKAKKSNAKKGSNNPMFGTVSPNKGKTGKDSPRWGMKHSEKTKRVLSEKAKNRKRINCEYCKKTNILPGHYGRYHKDGKCGA